MYKCCRCGKLYDEIPKKIKCTSCMGGIFVKVRSDVVRRVEAR